MDSILDLLQGGLGSQLIQGASDQLGMDKQQTTKAIGAALPLMLGALKNNASSDQGASSLLNALGDQRHSGGSVLDTLGSILGGNQIDSNGMDDGAKILGHMFGSNVDNAAGAVSKSAGIDIGKAMGLLKLAAPFVMSYLGRMKLSKGVNDSSGLGDLLGGLLGGGGSQAIDAAALLQNFSDNDSSLEDIAGMVLGGKSGSSGLGGVGNLLGGLFGKG